MKKTDAPRLSMLPVMLGGTAPGPISRAHDETVLVRAHTSNGGYYRAAMRVNATEDFVEAADIGADFAPALQDVEPLPTNCGL